MRAKLEVYLVLDTYGLKDAEAKLEVKARMEVAALRAMAAAGMPITANGITVDASRYRITIDDEVQK